MRSSRKTTYLGLVIASFFLSLIVPVPLEFSLFTFFCALFYEVLGKRLVLLAYLAPKIFLLPPAIITSQAEIAAAVNSAQGITTSYLFGSSAKEAKELFSTLIAFNNVIVPCLTVTTALVLSLLIFWMYKRAIKKLRIVERVPQLF